MSFWFTEDPADVWENLDSGLLRKVERWVNRAEHIIRQRFPDIDQRVDSGELAPEVIAGVVEEMVTRAIDNEDRGGIESEELPEWSVKYATGVGLGRGSTLFLTTDEFALLAPPRQAARVSSIRMRRAYEATDPSPEAS